MSTGRQKRAAKLRSKWKTEEAVGLAVVTWVTVRISGVFLAVVTMSTALLKTLQVVASGIARKEILAPKGGGTLFQQDCPIGTYRPLQTCSFYHTGHRLG